MPPTFTAAAAQRATPTIRHWHEKQRGRGNCSARFQNGTPSVAVLDGSLDRIAAVIELTAPNALCILINDLFRLPRLHLGIGHNPCGRQRIRMARKGVGIGSVLAISPSTIVRNNFIYDPRHAFLRLSLKEQTGRNVVL